MNRSQYFLLVLSLFSLPVYASFANYNSVLIGERAAGMGGAFTALSNDPAGCSFYNPATLTRMKGNKLSASVNLFNKYDTSFGDQSDFGSAALRVNCSCPRSQRHCFWF